MSGLVGRKVRQRWSDQTGVVVAYGVQGDRFWLLVIDQDNDLCEWEAFNCQVVPE